jgi:hypothetical protein
MKIDKDHIFFKVAPIIIGVTSLVIAYNNLQNSNTSLAIAHKSLQNSNANIRMTCEQHSELESCRQQFTLVAEKPQESIFKRPQKASKQPETLGNKILLLPDKHSMDF